MHVCFSPGPYHGAAPCAYTEKESDPWCDGCAGQFDVSHAQQVAASILDVQKSWAARFPQPEGE